MADFEVHIDLGGRTRRIGLARSNRARGSETIRFCSIVSVAQVQRPYLKSGSQSKTSSSNGRSSSV